MIVGIPKELSLGERRVAATPETTAKLIKLGYEVWIEAGAGIAAHFEDASYAEAGARIVDSPAELWGEAQIIFKVRAPLQAADALNSAGASDELGLVQRGQLILCLFFPGRNQQLLAQLAARGASLLALDLIPRITRAQKMDVLSSMANIAGYRAVLEAAHEFGRFFTGQVTAAGKVAPAKVLVIGAGVAGLSAVGTARSLGAIVRAFDTRPAAREQVESLGAQFLEVKLKEDGTGFGGYAKEMSAEFIAAELLLFKLQAREVDIIVTTALIPGRPAPKLITTEIVQAMKPGSVIVDLAAEGGGNCELTKPGQIVREFGVTIIGYTDLPSRMASTASQLFSTNLFHLATELGNADNFALRLDDDVIGAALVLHNGELRWPRPTSIAVPATLAPAPQSAILHKAPQRHGASAHALETGTPPRAKQAWLWWAVLAALVLAVGWLAPAAFLPHFTVFVLACFVGWQVVWNVTPALHTPLMSVTNAISGIILIGGMLKTQSQSGLVIALAAGAVLIATINVTGGFFVTQRMLKMFQR